jgi:hypothetical protein
LKKLPEAVEAYKAGLVHDPSNAQMQADLERVNAEIEEESGTVILT